MSGGQQIDSGQGTVTGGEGVATTGSQINSGQGTVLGGPGFALSGNASTSGQGSIPGTAGSVRLQSRKVGGGTGTQALTGTAITSAAGLFTPGRGPIPVGQVAALLQGSFAKSQTLPLAGTAVSASQGSFASLSDPLWDAQRLAPGVVFSSRLQAALPQRGANIGVSEAYTLLGDHESLVSLDTSVIQPGAIGSLKFSVLNTSIASDGIVACYFGATRTFSPGDTVWFSYLVRSPIEQAYAYWSMGFGPAHKLSILSRSTGSNQVNEVVVQSNNNRGLIVGYAQDGLGGFNEPSVGAVTACSNTDVRHQANIDHGSNPLIGTDPDTGAAWSACAQDRARYGGLLTGAGFEFFASGYGDPLDGGFRQTPDAWIRVTCRVVIGTASVANSRWTMWAAPQGSPYTQVFDKTNVVLGNGPAYDTLWLLPYCSQRAPGGRKVTAVGGGIGGVSVPLCSPGNALGNGTLEYTASTGRFRYHSSNDSF